MSKILENLNSHQENKKLMTANEVQPEEVKTAVLKVKEHAKEKKEKIAEIRKQISDYRETVKIHKENMVEQPVEIADQDQVDNAFKEIEKAMEETNAPATGTPEAPKPGEKADVPKSRVDKISKGIEDTWDKTKVIFKKLTGLKTWQGWLDEGVDGVVEIYNTVTDWLKTSIAPIMAKFGMEVPKWMQPTPQELKDVQEPLKKLLKEKKIEIEIAVTDPVTDLNTAKELKKKEREYISKNPTKKKEEFYIALAAQIKKEDPSKTSATLNEFMDAASIVIPGATPAAAPAEDPDVKLESGLPEAVKKGLTAIANKDVAMGELDSTLKEITPSILDKFTGFSKARRDKMNTQIDEQLKRAGLNADSKKSLEEIKKKIA